jgi:hypothetical protein
MAQIPTSSLMPKKQNAELPGDDEGYDDELVESEGAKKTLPPAPLHWHEPKVHPEIVNHGAAIARLAVELARLDRMTTKSNQKKASAYLAEANALLNDACGLLPTIVNLSRPSADERERWSKERIEILCESPVVPWRDICAEGVLAKAAPKRKVKMQNGDGKLFTFTWKAYTQIEKSEGLRALLLRHAERMIFGNEWASKHLKKIERALVRFAHFKARKTWKVTRRKAWLQGRKRRAAKSRKRHKLSTLIRKSRWYWTVPMMVAAIKSTTLKDGLILRAWGREVIEHWRAAACRNFADRLLREAKAGVMSEKDFDAIAITRSLNPPGGCNRRTSGDARGSSGGKKPKIPK